MAMMLVPDRAQANDYLEKEKHYNAYASGANKVHFVIPVWAYGKSYDYYAYGDSYIAYTVEGGSETKIAWYKTDKYDENEKDSKKGTAYLQLLTGQGDIIVTSMANGVNYQVHDTGNWTEKLYVTQKEYDDCPQVTMLEFDWFIPESLEKKKFSVKIVSKFRRSYTDGNAMTCTTTYSGFEGTNNSITPQLYTPYLYTLNEKGVAGYGYAAVPYMVFQEPISYYTSFNPTEKVTQDVDRSGTIYVPTNDTVQEQLSATFTVVRDATTGSTRTAKTTAVDILPYHRIYDFAAQEETDSTGTFTGNNVLTWNIRNPQLKDLMDNDYFEVQRALESDFSDAERISIVQMRRDEVGQYTLVDNDRSTWTGNAEDKTEKYHLTARDNKYVVLDATKNTIAEIDATLHARDISIPGVPVYYRIRRASASMWDWDIDFSKNATLFNQNFLAPLADSQEAYTKDADYATNHKVNFRIKIENKRPVTTAIDKDKCDLTYSINRVLKEQMVDVTFSYQDAYETYDAGGSWQSWYRNPADYTLCRILDNDGKVYADWQKYSSSTTYHFPINHTIEVKLNNSHDGAQGGNKIYTFVLKSNCKIESNYWTEMGDDYDDILYWIAKINYYENPIESQVDAVKQAIIDSLYTIMQQTNSITYGRCMWDRSAQLILQRTIEETGQTMEFIIPQDSIKRQADGSWIATYSDIADQGCSHYKYAVRIDQSKSDLHVQNTSSLNPIAISGPSLYFDEAAKITAFTATQGDASTALKVGVLLRWEASSNAVDEFVLLRKEKDSSAAADTIYRGTDNSYLDRSAVPTTHYEYTIQANYTCNGKTTNNAMSAEGWRTPYGEIAGSILLPDNTGMAGVTVALQDGNGNTLRTMQTDASGAYKFDSLEYTLIETDCELATVAIEYIYNSGGSIGGISIGSGPSLSNSDIYFRFSDKDGHVLQDWKNNILGGTTYKYPLGTVIEVKSNNTGLFNKGVIASYMVTGNSKVSCAYRTGAISMFSPTFSKVSDVKCTSTITNEGNYSVIPTSQYGTFSFNNTSAGTASITLSQDNAVASGIDFVNTSTTRLTGRVLYKNTTIPVSGAMFLLNGDTVRRGNMPLTSGIDGNFELVVPLSQPCKLQVFKTGHTFEGDGILRVEGDEEMFALTKPLDGVRFYDETKVRLVGRVAGGNDQRDLPHGFGLGKNNLGDDLQLVLQLEGDNTAHFVFDPNDLTLDTVQQTIGATHTTFEKKRVIIRPDVATGEFAADLFPVKYKVVQATANGYATLFAAGEGSETFDLVNAPLDTYVAKYDGTANTITETITQGYSKGIAKVYDLPRNNDLTDGDSILYNAVYDRIYHSPVEVSLTQVLYGMEKEGFGEEEMEVSSMNIRNKEKVALYEKQADGTVSYLMGHPVFMANRKYQFIARAYERYYYNNDPQSGMMDEVPQRGGSVRVHNGLKSATSYQDYALDSKGENKSIALEVQDIDTENSGENALRTVSTALQVDGNYVETAVFQAFVSGTDVQNGDLISTESEVVLLDIIRDPGGNGSSAWVESGTTYNFAYTESYNWEIGIELTPQWGVHISQDIGAIAAPEGAGSYIGSTYESDRQLSFSLPITHEWKWGYKYNYSFTTTDRISTASSKGKDGVSSNADVFLGTTVSQLAGKAKTVGIISDSMYIARQPAINAGVMKVLGHGTDAYGNRYHLVTGQQIVLGSQVGGTFVYTQHYILNTLIPKLALERQNLLMNFANQEAAQDYADQTGEEVYWYHSAGDNVSLIDSLPYNIYEMIVPQNSDRTFTDRVAALDNMIMQWITILYQNEKEKVMARMMGMQVGTWSVSSGASITHTDSYSASAQYNEMPQGGDLVGALWASNSTKAGEKLLGDMKNIVGFFKGMANKQIGQSVQSVLNDMKEKNGKQDPTQNQQHLGTTSNTSKFSLDYDPVFSFDCDDNLSQEQTSKKTSGFTLGADTYGDITVSVYRAEYDSVWDTQTEFIRDNVDQANNQDLLYGSYVFYTVAGSSYCPHEAEEKTQFYNKGTILNNETQWVNKPELSIDTHEQTGVQPDKRATFRVTMMNNGQVQTGLGASGTVFTFALWGDSNPNGAKVYVDGAPLIEGIPMFLVPGQAVTKTIEVERGTVDDYDNLTLALSVADCPKTNTSLQFSVHFLPVSSDVTISMPRQNWVMNTLSQHDSAGYYLPVEIDGFDIHHKNFDHIEFQYKLSTESEEMWVNQCSFYANDSLYALATGNKALIRNGRIEPFRFYGERDPMEQKYDLRAVAFCRYGSGFVTKSSPVISGTKDTRPPRVFGEPEPVNAILGVGDNLKLRFNEPIAGNYLDEDNNFELKGVTNATGITTKASVHFDGTQGSYAATQVSRNLAGKSVTIDMLVKPTAPNAEAVFFSHGEGEQQVRFGKTTDNRLYVSNSEGAVYSKPAEAMLDFTRVVATYDASTNSIHFYAGTQDLTDGTGVLPQNLASYYKTSAPLVFGRGFDGNMLEVRLWVKALTQEEIAATHLRYLTGYERELAAYYPMTEGQGTTLKDKAQGATLQLHGATWHLPKGISLAIRSGEEVQLNGNLLGRSKVYDETLMLWFRPTSTSGDVFKAGHANDSVGTLLSIENGNLVLHSDSNQWSLGAVGQNEWNQLVLTVNRTYNNVSAFVNGNMTATFAATELAGINGAMYLGGNGFEGNVDEFVLFEQALPKTLVEEYGNHSPAGDEMGLMAYLPFEAQKLNANGILELVFSVNDQRVFKDANGNVVEKEVPLVVESQKSKVEGLADKANYAPVTGSALLSKLNFDWAFNQDELLINLKMQDREINKQTMYITVRDVEDLNGNPMPSPVTWVAYVDRNSVTWKNNKMEIYVDYGVEYYDSYRDMRIINNSGKRHQFTIESLPDWLSVNQHYGTIQPNDDYTVQFTYNTAMPVGTYTDMVYVTDENGLSEPLKVIMYVEARCPYDGPDESQYTLNMSVCGQVILSTKDKGTMYDTDREDKVIALYRNNCVGMANVAFNNTTNTTDVFLTIHGNEAMSNRELNFVLWQASTGRVLNLTPSRKITFAHGNVYGCGNDSTVVFTTSGSETQNINVSRGWSWISTNLNLQPEVSALNAVMTVADPWSEGDLIKNPDNRQFSTYSETQDAFMGSLASWDYTQIYMIYCKQGNTLRLNGDQLAEADKAITLRGDGQWSALPCLLSESTPLTEAMADYYDNASVGDLIKAHNRFAIFSSDKHWVGDLTALRPGEGYLFRRMDAGDVTIRFFNQAASNAPARLAMPVHEEAAFHGNGATNMTMIAKLSNDPINDHMVNEQMVNVLAYIDGELVGVATQIDSLCFLTISADKMGELRFTTEDGTPLVSEIPIHYATDSHHGSLKAPIILKPGDPDRVRKVIENNHVVIIRNGERYDVTGKKLNK